VPWRFTVLASGSGGNASLLHLGDFGLLIDAGIGPRVLARRLAEVGASWQHIHAILLTHTHSDHWSERTMQEAASRQLPLICHPAHFHDLAPRSEAMVELHRKGQLVFYESNPLEIQRRLRVCPIPLCHDSDPTFGFRIDGDPHESQEGFSIGYLADLGCWQDSTVEAVRGVDMLALEFNHDETLLRNSPRPAHLVQRVLGDQGHLSNDQAAGFLRLWLTKRRVRKPWRLVQLHLSTDCNRPDLARAAATAVLEVPEDRECVHTSSQNQVCSVQLG
jgi:phosphoribosyl 1,2-cyclic phosphodiesterase